MKEYIRKEAEIEPTALEWAQLASFIDGEGSILITERHYKSSPYPGMYIRVVIANTDPRLPLWCKKRFGGVFVIGDKQRKPQHRKAYKWHVSCNQAASVLEKCLPYFILKREQAEVALAFQKTVKYGRGRGIKVSDEDRSLRELCKKTLHELRWRVVIPIETPDNKLNKKEAYEALEI